MHAYHKVILGVVSVGAFATGVLLVDTHFRNVAVNDEKLDTKMHPEFKDALTPADAQKRLGAKVRTIQPSRVDLVLGYGAMGLGALGVFSTAWCIAKY